MNVKHSFILLLLFFSCSQERNKTVSNKNKECHAAEQQARKDLDNNLYRHSVPEVLIEPDIKWVIAENEAFRRLFPELRDTLYGDLPEDTVYKKCYYDERYRLMKANYGHDCFDKLYALTDSFKRYPPNQIIVQYGYDKSTFRHSVDSLFQPDTNVHGKIFIQILLDTSLNIKEVTIPVGINDSVNLKCIKAIESLPNKWHVIWNGWEDKRMREVIHIESITY